MKTRRNSGIPETIDGMYGNLLKEGSSTINIDTIQMLILSI